MEVYTLTNVGKQKLTLKEPPFSSGGEGYIYEITGQDNRVVKIYKTQEDAAKREDKLKAMIKIAHTQSFVDSSLCDEIAWPISPIFDLNDRFIGYGMKKIKSEYSFTSLYKYPAKENSWATIEKRIDILINLCWLIERLHWQGQVFGDFNPENIRVDRDGKVTFMDADSFAVYAGEKKFKCVVCLPGYVAPELIRKTKSKNGSFENLDFDESFSKYTDYFGLALHIFHMLFRSDPFANRSVATTSLKTLGSDTDIVEKGLSPFYVDLPNRTIPIQAIPTDAFPDYINDMFKRALLTKNPADRPTPKEWAKALVKYKSELDHCYSYNTHAYWNGNKECPYCKADKKYNDLNNSLIADAGQNYGKVKTVPPKTSAHKPITNATVFSNKVKQTASNVQNNVQNSFTQKPYAYNIFSNILYWIVTMFIGVGIQALAGVFLYPYICESFLDSATEPLAIVINIALCLAGVIGSIVYNVFWVDPPTDRKHNWYEYFLSILTNIGFTIGLVLIAAILAVALFIVIAIGVIALIIFIIYLLVSGG